MGQLLMTDRARISDLLKEPDHIVLSEIPALLPDLSTTDLFDLLTLLENAEIFSGRLPLRLKLYAIIAESSRNPSLRLIALLRLLRRLGARKDIPDLGGIPQQSDDFAEYLALKADELCDDADFAEAVKSLALTTRAYRSGDVREMIIAARSGLDALGRIDAWENPPSTPNLTDLALSETGHELTFLAASAAFRGGDTDGARRIAEAWAEKIDKWEESLGGLPRQRYQYYQLVGHLDYEVGLYEPALEAYEKALEYAPTPFRKAFLWLSEAQIERYMGRTKESWEHASSAIDAILESPYPQTAALWIEWLALDADTSDKRAEIESMRRRLESAGGVEINRVTRAMTELYRLLARLRTTDDPSGLALTLDNLIDMLEEAGSWPNLVTILATRAVVSGRLNDRQSMDDAISRAREIMTGKLADEARPPAEFFVESAHALALRNVGAYDEAFNALFERALEARKKYPGAMGPDEQTAVEALYYLGALAGNDPDTIQKRISDTII